MLYLTVQNVRKRLHDIDTEIRPPTNIYNYLLVATTSKQKHCHHYQALEETEKTQPYHVDV